MIATLGILSGICILVVGVWWQIKDARLAFRQRKLMKRVERSMSAPATVVGWRPIFMARFRSLAHFPVAVLNLETAGTQVNLDQPLLLGKTWEKNDSLRKRLKPGSKAEILRDEQGVVAVRLL